MDVIEAVRQLGKAIQSDERYLRFAAAGKANDEDMELKGLVGEFNIARMSIDNELAKDEKDKDETKIKEFNATLRRLYGKIMCNEKMIEYNQAKSELETVIKRINGIIDLCIEGKDPDTCEPEEMSCTGSCETCGGCH